MKRRAFAWGIGAGFLATAVAARATTYTSDGHLADFTSQVGSYATFSNFSSGDVSSPYTPTTANVNSGLRVYGGGGVTGLNPGNNWILATFALAQGSILVFPNMDHLGAQFDGYQYQIWGSNDGSTWSPLFDAVSVVGAGEPFTLGSFTGTAPTWVNNVVTPGAGPGGEVGYIARFDFSLSYSDFAFGASTVALAQGNPDQEFSAVASELTIAPEPATLSLLGLGLASLVVVRRRNAA
jgi:hypothetical protein